MILNDLQTSRVRQILKNSNIESKSIRKDLLDHLCCMVEELMEDGTGFDDALKSVLNQFPADDIKSVEYETLKILNMEKNFSKRISLLATIPFGLFGLYWIFSNSALNVPGVIENILLLSSIISMFALLCIGWINNYPVWSFPAIGFCVFFTLFFMNVSVPVISDEVLGLWAMTPLILTLLISQILKPGIEPVKCILKKIKEEPFLILFALYGISPFIVLMLSDEIHANWMIPVSIFVTAILSAGIFFFLSLENRVKRVISIILSGIVGVALTITASNIYWG